MAFLLFTHAYILPRYVIFFLLGIGAERSKWAPSGRVAGAALAASVTLVMLLALVPATHAIILPPSGEDGTGVCDKYNHLLSAGLALLILPWTVYTTRQRGWKHDGILADLSFIFYAFHYPFLRFFNFENPKTASVGFLFTLTTCVSVWWFDNRLQGMRSAWVSKQVKAHPRAALTKGETPTEMAAADSAECKAVAF